MRQTLISTLLDRPSHQFYHAWCFVCDSFACLPHIHPTLSINETDVLSQRKSQVQSRFVIDGSLFFPEKILFHAPIWREAHKMASLFEAAAAAQEAEKMRNIAELGSFNPRAVKFEDITRTLKDGTTFSAHVVVVGGVEYRVPHRVLLDLKELIEVRPDLETIRVIKTGQGKEGTRYSIAIDG